MLEELNERRSTQVTCPLNRIKSTAVKWGHLSDNPARRGPADPEDRPAEGGSDDQTSVNVLEALPPLARAMVGLGLLTGLRRGELFAMRWRNVSLEEGHLTVEKAVYEGAFGTPKTSAGLRRVPVESDGQFVGGMEREERTAGGAGFLDVARKVHFAKQRVAPVGVSGLRETQAAERDLAHVPTDLRVLGTRQGRAGQVVAELMGHTNADVTLNLYTQVLDASLRTAVDRIGGEFFTLVPNRKNTSALTH